MHSMAEDRPEYGNLYSAGLGLLSIVALACLHFVLYHLKTILVPFVLGGFIVLTLQPSVEVLYRLLAGLDWPNRWFCCCLRRRRTRRTSRRPRVPSTIPSSPTSPASSSFGAGMTSHESDGESDEDTLAQTPLLQRALTEDPETLGMQLLDGACRFLAVTIVFLLTLLLAGLVVLGICNGALQMKENWSAYKAGIDRLSKLQESALKHVMKELHLSKSLEERLLGDSTLMDALLQKSQDWVWVLLNTIVSGLSEGVSSAAIMLLYVLFWLLQPLPTGGKAGRLVRRYLYKKTIVSFLYGACVTMLFTALSIDLAILFGMVSFFLNFVPEIGSFISMLVPVPVILLDGRLASPFLVLSLAFTGQIFLKFIFANVLEVKMIETDQEMSIHPVWVILGISYFGFIWGPIGMLISVPILAMLKTAALSTTAQTESNDNYQMLSRLSSTFLACLEGRAQSSAHAKVPC